MSNTVNPAIEQFHTSSIYPTPAGYKSWEIRNDYPQPKAEHVSASGLGPLPARPGQLPTGDVAPWLDIDFVKDPYKYCAMVKEYCWDGMMEADFIPQNCHVRDWYHAAWLHFNPNGREPLRGLTFERPTPPYELSANQKRFLQSWAVGFFNSAAASVLGDVWQDRAKPTWDKDLKFPLGSCIFKLLFTDATDGEVFTMKGAPAWKAVIAEEQDPSVEPDPARRNTEPSTLRLHQIDFATRDDRAPIGWVFGTSMYDGSGENKPFIAETRRTPTTPWDNIIPIGIMWGNDPELTQAAFNQGQKPKETWINPAAEALRKKLNGKRPSWGWNGRLNGPENSFISACASCHATAQRLFQPAMVPTPTPIYNKQKKQWIPPNDQSTMHWFRNIPAGKPFIEGGLSSDFNLQVMIGVSNYDHWNAGEQDPKSIMQSNENRIIVDRRPLRAGPLITYV